MKDCDELRTTMFELLAEERSWGHPVTSYDALSETGEMGLLSNSTQCDAVDYRSKRLDYRLIKGFNIMKGEC